MKGQPSIRKNGRYANASSHPNARETRIKIDWDEGVLKTVVIRYQNTPATSTRGQHLKEPSQRRGVLRFVWDPPKHMPGSFTLQRMT